MAVLTPAMVFPPGSKPKKAEIIQLLDQIQGTGSNPAVVKQTKAALDAVTPVSENYGGMVLNDPDPTKNGYYYRESAAWVKGRGLPDSIAEVTLAGPANAQTGTASGVNPADVVTFFAVVGTENTGPLTLSIAGETPRDVVNSAGNDLSAGEWTGAVLFFLNGDGDYQLLLNPGAEAAAAQSASGAADSKNEAEVIVANAALALQRYVAVDVVDVGGGNPALDYGTGDAIDGVTLSVGWTILRATPGGDPSDGIYVVPASGPASRVDLFDTYDSLPGAAVRVMRGTAKANTDWRVNSVPGGTLGVTDILIEEFSQGIEEITDAEVASNAGIKSSKLVYSQNEADPSTFPFRTVYHRLRERISVKDAGAVGDGSADDTAAFQEAIDYAQTRSLKAVHLPAHDVSAYYKIGGAEILITSPIAIIGEHPLVTVGNQAGGLGPSNYLFKVDGTVSPNYEQFAFKNLSLRPDIGGTACRGILLNRVAYPVIEDVVVSNGVIGIELTGDRGYASQFQRVRINGCTSIGFSVASFTGGGQHNFIGCALNGNANGFILSENSVMSGVNFIGTAFEGNTVRPFRAEGDIHGMVFTGCYAEKNTEVGGYTLGFVPSFGKVQRGIVITGGIWETDAEDWPFLFGGAGTINAVEISGVEAEGYGTALVRSNANGVVGGQIRSNYLQNLTSVVDGTPFTRVAIANNENFSGAVN